MVDTSTAQATSPASTSTTPTIPTTPPAPKPGLFINRNFALLWGGQTVSLIGDYLFNTTLILWIASQIALHQVWAPLAVSGVLIAAAAPILLVQPLAGVFVDRWDKRRTMVRMDITRTLLILALMLIAGQVVPLPFSLSPLWQVGSIYIAVFLVSCCAQFFNPSQTALIGDLVAEPLRPRASGLSQVTASFATIIGPPLATALFFLVGVRLALVCDALSFVISFVTLLAIHAPKAATSLAEGERGHFFQEFRTGLRFFLGSRVLITMLIGIGIAMAGAGAINTLDYFFVVGNLHAPASTYGYVGAIFGVGILIGAIFSSFLVQKIGVARSLGLSLTGLGVLLTTLSRMTTLPPALVLLFLAGALQAMLNVSAGPLLLQVTPRALIGRVEAIIMPVLNLTSLLSIAASGYLASTLLLHFHAQVGAFAFGPVDTIYSVAGLLALLGGLYALINLRRGYTEPQTNLNDITQGKVA